MERLYGFNKIGRISSLPKDRRGDMTTGCYFTDFQSQDLKINAWAYSMGLTFMLSGMTAWYANMHKYILENRAEIEYHINSKDLDY